MAKADAVMAETPQPAPRASIARNAFHLVLGQVATTALAILFSAAVGRTLGPRDFGVYFLVSSFAAFAYVLVDWGQLFYVIREVARTPERSGALVGSTLGLRLFGALLVAVPAGLLTWVLGYDKRTCWFTVAYLLAMLPFALGQTFCFAFRGRDRMELDAATSVVNKSTGLALAVAALALGTGLGGVIVSQALAGGVALFVASRLYRRVARGSLRFSRETAREVFKGGTTIVGMMVAVHVQPYLDAVVLSKLVPADAIGWFGAAKNIMGTLLAPALIIGAAAYPRLSRAASSQPLFKSEFQATVRPALWLGSLGAVGTWLFADAAIALVYGHRQFGPAGTILKIFGPGLFLIFIDVMFGNALTAMGRASSFSIVKLASVGVSTGLDLLLIPWFQTRYGNGGMGTVAAFILSEFVVFAGAVWLMPRGSLGRGMAVDMGRAVVCVAATGLIFAAVPPLPIFVGIPVCVAAFSLSSLATGLLRRRDLELLQSSLRKQRPQVAPSAVALESGADNG
jgi:O-antigen/teichoic acid export membrane protein